MFLYNSSFPLALCNRPKQKKKADKSDIYIYIYIYILILVKAIAGLTIVSCHHCNNS